MALIQWSEKLAVNIPSIDGQHRILVDLVNQLHDAMKAGRSKEVIADVLNRLIDYTKLHFAHEEACMTKSCFAHAKDHKCQHDELASKVLQFQADFSAGKVGLTMEVLNFLQQWLSGHIMKSDKAYSDHLISHHIQ
ncbi:MAG: hemerythrin family protein [Bacteroidetes bacterium]|nr:hemerythrin family protein [Bacteroidota bacterium]